MTDDLTFRADPDLLPEERETYIHFASDEDRLTIHTDDPHVAHRLIQHPEFVETRRYRSEDVVHGVEGSRRINRQLIRRDPRASTGHADIITRVVLDDD